MHDVYSFVSGPMVWVAFIVFIAGSLFKLIGLIRLAQQKEKFIFTYMSWKYSLRSILHWMTPFGTQNMKQHPFFTIVTFVFHICLLATPLFLSAHIILFEESWGISWWSLPDGLADIMTALVILCCIFFLVRRLKEPEVQYVTSTSDYILLLVVALPFLSGFLAYHQWLDYPVSLIIHIVSGEVMLMVIPFTRLVHMLFAPLTRAYMGSEFGGVRKAKDW